ncbi:MAG: rod shape-determining protein RodA [Candidatus Omnitrophota bacterium]|nr:rod shape-determining protein RodA [Candidatus Omnitrophota bacterium]
MFQRWAKGIHWPLVYSIIGLSVMGVLFTYSASYHDPSQYELKQVLWAGGGLIFLFVIPFLSYRSFLSVSLLLYVVFMVLLVWVLFAGDIRLGAQRWIRVGSLVLQPSEFAKLATVLALAHFLGSVNPWEQNNRSLLLAIALVLLPCFLIMKQPDLGTALLFLPMAVVVLFLWGIRYRYIIFAFIAGLISIPLAWQTLEGYQKKRILVFLNPSLDPLGAGYTALQSRIAVGAGGFWGKGFLHGTQSQLKFVPEHHTDFIFCVIGEEWGFLGALLVLLLYGILFRSIFQVISHTTDIKAKLLAAGIAAILFAQVFINIGMSIGLMPITGLTLPLISYGGSSFLATSIALGLILSIHKERSIF